MMAEIDDGLAFAMESIGIEGEVVGWLGRVGKELPLRRRVVKLGRKRGENLKLKNRIK